MDQDTIRKISQERLSCWLNSLVREHATPVLMFGVGHDMNSGDIHCWMVDELGADGVKFLVERLLNRINEGDFDVKHGIIA